MRRCSIAIAVCLVGLAAAPGCQQLARHHQVATINGTDRIADVHVESVLRRHWIYSYAEGSVVWGVFVAEWNAARAKRILLADAERHRYPIWIYGHDGKERAFDVRKEDWETPVVNRGYAELVKEPGYGPDTEMGAVLRADWVRRVARTCPFVAQIRRVPRRYLDSDGVFRTGYDGSMTMQASSEADWPSAWVGFQVFEGGTQVFIRRGNDPGGTDSVE